MARKDFTPFKMNNNPLIHTGNNMQGQKAFPEVNQGGNGNTEKPALPTMEDSDKYRVVLQLLGASRSS